MNERKLTQTLNNQATRSMRAPVDETTAAENERTDPPRFVGSPGKCSVSLGAGPGQLLTRADAQWIEEDRSTTTEGKKEGPIMSDYPARNDNLWVRLQGLQEGGIRLTLVQSPEDGTESSGPALLATDTVRKFVSDVSTWQSMTAHWSPKFPAVDMPSSVPTQEYRLPFGELTLVLRPGLDGFWLELEGATHVDLSRVDTAMLWAVMHSWWLGAVSARLARSRERTLMRSSASEPVPDYARNQRACAITFGIPVPSRLRSGCRRVGADSRWDYDHGVHLRDVRWLSHRRSGAKLSRRPQQGAAHLAEPTRTTSYLPPKPPAVSQVPRDARSGSWT
jgi:hypothetical protein